MNNDSQPVRVEVLSGPHRVPDINGIERDYYECLVVPLDVQPGQILKSRYIAAETLALGTMIPDSM